MLSRRVLRSIEGLSGRPKRLAADMSAAISAGTMGSTDASAGSGAGKAFGAISVDPSAVFFADVSVIDVLGGIGSVLAATVAAWPGFALTSVFAGFIRLVVASPPQPMPTAPTTAVAATLDVS